VTARGRLTGCVVKSESPPGWGFGEAALELAPRFRMKPQTRDGRATNEGVVTVPVHFWVHGKVLLDCALVEGRARSCTTVSETFPGRGMAAMAIAFAEGRKPGRQGTSVKAGRLRWRLDTPVPIPECAAGDTSFPCGGPDS
jgi:TonB family protein